MYVIVCTLKCESEHGLPMLLISLHCTSINVGKAILRYRGLSVIYTRLCFRH